MYFILSSVFYVIVAVCQLLIKDFLILILPTVWRPVSAADSARLPAETPSRIKELTSKGRGMGREWSERRKKEREGSNCGS